MWPAAAAVAGAAQPLLDALSLLNMQARCRTGRLSAARLQGERQLLRLAGGSPLAARRCLGCAATCFPPDPQCAGVGCCGAHADNRWVAPHVLQAWLA